jgi:hypothetical protein
MRKTAVGSHAATNWGERQEFGSRGAQAVRAFCRPLPSPMWAWDENGRQGRIAGRALRRGLAIRSDAHDDQDRFRKGVEAVAKLKTAMDTNVIRIDRRNGRSVVSR